VEGNRLSRHLPWALILTISLWLASICSVASQSPVPRCCEKQWICISAWRPWRLERRFRPRLSDRLPVLVSQISVVPCKESKLGLDFEASMSNRGRRESQKHRNMAAQASPPPIAIFQATDSESLVPSRIPPLNRKERNRDETLKQLAKKASNHTLAFRYRTIVVQRSIVRCGRSSKVWIVQSWRAVEWRGEGGIDRNKAVCILDSL